MLTKNDFLSLSVSERISIMQITAKEYIGIKMSGFGSSLSPNDYLYGKYTRRYEELNPPKKVRKAFYPKVTTNVLVRAMHNSEYIPKDERWSNSEAKKYKHPCADCHGPCKGCPHWRSPESVESDN